MPNAGTANASPGESSTEYRGGGRETSFPVERGREDLIGGPPLPVNDDAEQGLLAACIIDQTGETTSLCVEAGLDADFFHSPAHQMIFSALLDLHGEGAPVSEILLAEQLLRNGKLDDVGGAATLAALTGRIETPAHAPYWLEIVREKHLLRNCIRVGRGIIDRASQQEGDLEGFLDSVEQSVMDLNKTRVSDATVPFSEPVRGATEQILRILNNEEVDGVKSGYPELDSRTNGFKPGEMIVLAARPSVGKTSLAMNMVENFVLAPERRERPRNVLVFSLEMSAVSLALRLICGRARVNQTALQKGYRRSKADQEALNHAATEFGKAPIFVDDTGGLSIHQLRAKARRAHSKRPLSLIVIDYLQLITGDARAASRETAVAEMSKGIKAMAKELDVPVIVLSQLNRDSDKDKRDPRLSDLRESGSIEQDADVVLLLSKAQKGTDVRDGDDPDAENDGEQENYEPITLILAKQRNGPTGKFDLAFRRQFTRFETIQSENRMN